MRPSLRLRLLAGTSLAAILTLTLLGIAIYVAMRHALMRDFDASLAVHARLVAGMLDQDDSKLTFEFDPRQMPDFVAGDREKYFEVWREDGSVLARSPSLQDHHLPRIAQSDSIADIQLPNGESGRAFMISFTPSEQGETESKQKKPQHTALILIASRPVDVQRTLALLGGLLTILCSAAVVIMGVVLLRVVSRGLIPVNRLAGEIGSFNETDLSHRLSSDFVPQELTPMVEKLNGLLARLEEAFSREKCFTADVSHELRTPLAGLRSILEVCRSRPREAAAYESAIDDCHAITDRMQAMVQSLLFLARSDAGQISLEQRDVDLVPIIADSWRLFDSRAQSRHLQVTLTLPQTCPARTDPDKLQIVLHNLLDNALSYIDEAGYLRLSLRSDSKSATIEIANTGSTITAQDIPHLFDRFWRADPSRTESNLHCGLGLSICDRLTKLLGGKINIRTATAGEFVVGLILPL